MTKATSLVRRRFELMAAEYLERMGERIRARREEMGLSQDALAALLPGSTNGQRVSLWELGKHRPHNDSLEALARVLKVDVAYFMAPEAEKDNGTPDLFPVPTNDDIEPRLAKIEELLKENNRLLKRLATAAVPRPPADLGRVAEGSEPTTPTAPVKRRRRAGGSQRDTE